MNWAYRFDRLFQEGEKFSVQPWIELLDETGARVRSTEFSISVRLVRTDSDRTVPPPRKSKKNKFRSVEDEVVEGIMLTGTLTVQVGSDGFAKFTDLGVTGTSSGVPISLEFYLEGAEVCVSINIVSNVSISAIYRAVEVFKWNLEHLRYKLKIIKMKMLFIVKLKKKHSVEKRKVSIII